MGKDYKENLINHIKKNLKKGYTEEALKWALINQGYVRSIVENAIIEANKQLAQEVPVLKEKPRIKYEVYDKDNKPIKLKRPWWKKLFG